MNFSEKLDISVDSKNSLLCVGIDPQMIIEKEDKYTELFCFGKRNNRSKTCAEKGY